MGLTACLIELNVRGKHVILSNFTFVATIQAVILAGGIPLICDIDSRTLEIDFMEVDRILKSGKYNIGAVIPTRVMGYVNDFSPLIRLCAESEVPIVVDAAGAFPESKSQWEFDHLAQYEVFSFHATKVFGIGEGGLVVGRASDLEMIKQKVNFGISLGEEISFKEGLNAKADEFAAARSLARFANYKKDVVKRRNFASMYSEIIEQNPSLRTLPSNQKTVFAYFPVIFPTEIELIKFQNGIEKYINTRRYYYPTLKSGFKGDSTLLTGSNLELSESIARRILCLPVYSKFDPKLPNMIKRKVEQILEEIK
jgi:dTDP-4-amino-4,6-dideoxygalactose transaminase